MLESNIQFVPGVGEARAKLLDQELHVRTVGDMLRHFPTRYIDRTKIYRIAEITEGAPALVQFRARVTGVAYAGEGRKRRFTVYVKDPSGAAELVWFQGIKWIEKRIEVGREYLVFGRPSFYRSELSMAHPELETIEQALSRKPESGMQGIYPSTEKLSNVLGTKGMYRIICHAWQLAKDHVEELLPEALRTRYGLMPLREAYYNIHFPQSPEALRQAQYRLKFDELLGVQLNVQSRRTARMTKNDGFLFPKVGGVFNTFYTQKLPFPLTGAQKRVIKEIRSDTVTGFQMNRLLQGDVGSGKTLVALMSMLLAVDNGYQACMMAPTEILARQHFATFSRMLDGLGVRAAVLTGASKSRERRQALEGIASGEVQILIGTHALIEDRVQFANLGFVVIDEQHRFGVEQRDSLRLKAPEGTFPHVLVMTATPIPRTIAMTVFGDLEVSSLHELPGGRKPIQSSVVPEGKPAWVRRAWQRIREEVAAGHQAYIVCPRIEGEGGVLELAEELQNGALAGLRIMVLHGRMDDKDDRMAAFARGEVDVLVSTTVIEVGVDVANATIILIRESENFGVSQLHQLRGRVGRGGNASLCLFHTLSAPDSASFERINKIAATSSGFELTELDMDYRREGDVLGTRQSGRQRTLQLLDLNEDLLIIERAYEDAYQLVEDNPELAFELTAEIREKEQEYLDKA